MSRFLPVLVCCWVAGVGRGAQAEVVVVTNRSAAAVVFKLASPRALKTEVREFKLASGEVLPIPVAGPMLLSFSAGGQRRAYRVASNGLYFFGESRPGQLDLEQIGLGPQDLEQQVSRGAEPTAGTVEKASARVLPVVIPVKVLFDEDEVTPRLAWERRIRARFDEASRVIEKHCFVRFEIVAIQSWRSEDTIVNLEEALGEFERSVDPAPARLAVGFTGQNKARHRYLHLGGTRGPLHTHLLVREWVNHNTEAERLEVLIHELGHFLGAVHSPESNSVMRTVLGDRQAREVKFRIQFDPLNTLAMCLVGEALKVRPQVRLAELQPATQMQLRSLYTELARALPDDPAANRYLRLLGPMGPASELGSP